MTLVCVQLVITLVLIVYVIMVSAFTLTWIRKPVQVPISREAETSTMRVSVVVAVRNEALRIGPLLHSLDQLDYPEDLLEICFGDDYSDDATCTLIEEWAAHSRFRVKVIKGDSLSGQGKKTALARAISCTEGNIIVTTDADCTVLPGWITIIVHFFRSTGARMVSGMVRMDPGHSFFTRLQALEFLGLTGSGAVTMMSNNPILCNGANLAFTRDAYIEAGGYTYGKHSASGDDTFLMLRIHELHPGSVHFLKNCSVIVTTQPLPTLTALYRQRVRWISKMQHYREIRIVWAALPPALVNIMLLVVAILGSTGAIPLTYAIMYWFIKALSDFLFIGPVTGFTGDRKLLYLFLPLLLLYPVYGISGICAALIVKTYEWKGRTLRT